MNYIEKKSSLLWFETYRLVLTDGVKKWGFVNMENF
jgi:hypothetical protein